MKIKTVKDVKTYIERYYNTETSNSMLRFYIDEYLKTSGYEDDYTTIKDSRTNSKFKMLNSEVDKLLKI